MSDKTSLVWAGLMGGGLVVALVSALAAFPVARARGVRPADTGLWQVSVVAAGISIASYFVPFFLPGTS